MFLILLQLSNAYAAIAPTVLGIAIFVNLEQSLNALIPIRKSDFPNAMVSNELHLKKAFCPILNNEFGRVTFTKEDMFEKAFLEMEVTPSSIMI